MKRSLKLTGALALALALAGCFDGSSKSKPPAMTQTVEFTRFVVAEINNTADNRAAVDINDLEFSFNDQDNEQAFDELF